MSTNQSEVSPDMSGQRMVVTDLNTAELIKHSSNAFLAMKVSFINMVSDLCEAAGADVNDVAIGLGMDPRIGPDFLRAGVGFGGYCLPKDLKAFIRITQDHQVDASLLQAIELVNNSRVDRFVSKLSPVGSESLLKANALFSENVMESISFIISGFNSTLI